MSKNSEVKITFKAFNKDFNKAMSEMNKETSRLRQEMKLQQEQLKHSGTETQKLESRMASLEKIYDVARQKTEATAKQLEQAKKLWGENSEEAKKLESQLKRNQIAEQQVANSITETQKALEQSKNSMAGLENEQKQLESQMSKLNAEYELQATQLKDNASETDKLKLKLDHLNKSHDVAKEKVRNYEQQLEQAKKQYGANSTEVNKYEKELLEARTAEEKLAKEITATNAKLKEQEDVLKKTAKSLKDTGDKMKSIGKDMSMKVTAPIVGLGAASVKVGAEFEKSMSKVQALSGATADDMQRLEEQARELGKTTVFSASQAAEAQAFLAMAGYDVNQILASMPGLLDLAAAGQMDLGNSADITTNIMSAFGLEAEKTTHTADVLAKASANANTDVSQLGEAIKYLGPVANSLGWELEESAAAVMSLSNAGIQGSMAGQAFASSLSRLSNPTKAMRGVMDELNLSFFDAQGKIKSMPSIIAELERSTQGMTAEQKSAALSVLFGAEAFKHWAVLLEEGSKTLSENTQMLIEADGAAKEMAETMSDNLVGRWNEFKSALQELALSIYETLEPALKTVLEILKVVVNIFNAIPGPIKTLIVVLAGLVAAIGPVLTALGFMLTNISALITMLTPGSAIFVKLASVFGGLSKVVGIVTGLFAKLGPVIALLTNPITLVITAIAGIGAILVYAYKEFEWFRDAVNAIWDFIKEITVKVFTSIGEFFKEWGPTILAILAGPLGLIIKFFIDNWEQIKEITSKAFEAVKEIIATIIGFIIDKVKTDFENMKNLITTIFTAIKDTILNIWEGIKTIFTTVMTAITNFITTTWNGIKNATTTIWNGIKDTLSNVWNGIKSTATNVWEGIKNFIMTPVNAVKDGVIKAFDYMKTRIASIWNGLKEVVKAPINTIIGYINTFINGLNKIQIPDWVPVVGGGNLNLPTIPMLAKGTNYFKGSEYGNLAIVGEKGPELVNLPIGSRVHTAQETQQMLNNVGGEITLNVPVEIDGRVIARATAKYDARELFNRQHSTNRGGGRR